MKIFKRKHFQALIYSIFLSLPLLSVLGRCVYTIANKNAYQSYYGETINEVEYEDITEIEQPNQYRFVNDTSLINTDTNGSQYFTFDKITGYSITNSSYYPVSLDGSDYSYCILYYVSNVRTLGLVGIDSSNTKYISLSLVNYIDFENFYAQGNTATSYFLPYLKEPIFNSYSYLDNAFEYSIDRFVSENDYGELDFFTWFSSLFLSGNSLDSLYIYFINWYMNYILYVSLGYLIFSVLLWFVNFFRRLVDDTQNINVGGM